MYGHKITKILAHTENDKTLVGVKFGEFGEL